MYFLSTFLSVAVLLALLIPGFILRKMRLISNHVAKDLSGILIYIGLPALKLKTFIKSRSYNINTITIS